MNTDLYTSGIFIITFSISYILFSQNDNKESAKLFWSFFLALGVSLTVLGIFN